MADAALDTAAATDAPAARCPVPHMTTGPLAAVGCPVPHGAAAERPPVQRSRADEIARRVLRIKERPAHVSEAAAQSAFSKSMAISATRCTLTYVVFPFVLPAAGFATGVGPVLGLVIGTIAIICDVYTVRRFFAADHRYRWHFTAIAVCVIGLLSVLLVQDAAHLVGQLT